MTTPRTQQSEHAAGTGGGTPNRAQGWTLYDNDESAEANGTPFRVCYFLRQEERFLYFLTQEEAFQWVADKPTLERPEIKDIRTGTYLYPKAP